MGGCRCTYRGCPSSSDSRTHFFHYPIRDRTRCLKWMRNAGTLEFCKLKEPQLKNKVICEHHFTKACFMNAKCDSLVHDAIPTEAGPCIKSVEEDQSMHSLKDLEIASAINSKTTDLETTDASSTTLTVSESPVLGLAFHSDDSDVKKPKFSQTYTEILTRKNTGMVEIWKRKLLESSQITAKRKKTPSIPLRCSKRNIDKNHSATVISKEDEIKLKAECIYKNKSNIQQIVPEQNAVKQHLNTVKKDGSINDFLNNLKTESIDDILDKGILISSAPPSQSIQASNLVNMGGNYSNNLMQTQTNNEILPDVILLPLDQNLSTVMNNHTNINEFKNTPSTIILNNDGTISQNSCMIKGNQKITILETKTLPVSHMSLTNSMLSSQAEADGALSVSENVMRMIERNSRDIIELKNLITHKQTEDKGSSCKVTSDPPKKRKMLPQRDSYVRKLELYSNVVQYLSPNVARLVYNDMFRSNKLK